MLEQITFFEFLVAFFMGLSALAFFLWAIMVGAFRDVEGIKHQVMEVENDER